MTITEYEYAATTVRALMAAEAAMVSVNWEAANVTRAQAEKLRLLHPHGTGDPLDRDQSAGSPVVI